MQSAYMGKCCLGNFTLEIRPLGGPVPECRTEAMRGQALVPHPPQQHEESHVGQRTAISTTEDEILGLASDGLV